MSRTIDNVPELSITEMITADYDTQTPINSAKSPRTDLYDAYDLLFDIQQRKFSVAAVSMAGSSNGTDMPRINEKQTPDIENEAKSPILQSLTSQSYSIPKKTSDYNPISKPYTKLSDSSLTIDNIKAVEQLPNIPTLDTNQLTIGSVEADTKKLDNILLKPNSSTLQISIESHDKTTLQSPGTIENDRPVPDESMEDLDSTAIVGNHEEVVFEKPRQIKLSFPDPVENDRPIPDKTGEDLDIVKTTNSYAEVIVGNHTEVIVANPHQITSNDSDQIKLLSPGPIESDRPLSNDSSEGSDSLTTVNNRTEFMVEKPHRITSNNFDQIKLPSSGLIENGQPFTNENNENSDALITVNNQAEVIIDKPEISTNDISQIKLQSPGPTEKDQVLPNKSSEELGAVTTVNNYADAIIESAHQIVAEDIGQIKLTSPGPIDNDGPLTIGGSEDSDAAIIVNNRSGKISPDGDHFVMRFPSLANEGVLITVGGQIQDSSVISSQSEQKENENEEKQNTVFEESFGIEARCTNPLNSNVGDVVFSRSTDNKKAEDIHDIVELTIQNTHDIEKTQKQSTDDESSEISMRKSSKLSSAEQIYAVSEIPIKKSNQISSIGVEVPSETADSSESEFKIFPAHRSNPISSNNSPAQSRSNRLRQMKQSTENLFKTVTLRVHRFHAKDWQTERLLSERLGFEVDTYFDQNLNQWHNRIAKIIADRGVSESDQIHAGDVLLEVNGRKLTGQTKSQAMEIFKKLLAPLDNSSSPVLSKANSANSIAIRHLMDPTLVNLNITLYSRQAGLKQSLSRSFGRYLYTKVRLARVNPLKTDDTAIDETSEMKQLGGIPSIDSEQGNRWFTLELEAREDPGELDNVSHLNPLFFSPVTLSSQSQQQKRLLLRVSAIKPQPRNIFHSEMLEGDPESMVRLLPPIFRCCDGELKIGDMILKVSHTIMAATKNDANSLIQLAMTSMHEIPIGEEFDIELLADNHMHPVMNKPATNVAANNQCVIS
jgi:hypothetical protein